MKKAFFFTNPWIEWSCRLLFTFNLIVPNLYVSTASFPMIEYIFLAIALWLYFAGLKWMCLAVQLWVVFLIVVSYHPSV